MGKSYVESSLKRFLKRKVKITMGFVVAFMIMGTGAFSAETETNPITIDKSEIDISFLNLRDTESENYNNKYNQYSSPSPKFILGENVGETLKVTGSISYGSTNKSDRAGIRFDLDLNGKNLEANLSRHEYLNPNQKEHSYFENVNITNGGTISIIDKSIGTGDEDNDHSNNSENLKHWAAKDVKNAEWTIQSENLIVKAGKTGIKVGNESGGKGIVHYDLKNMDITSKKVGVYAANSSEFDIKTENLEVNAGTTGILTEGDAITNITGKNAGDLYVSAEESGGISLTKNKATYGGETNGNGKININGFDNVKVESTNSAGIGINTGYLDVEKITDPVEKALELAKLSKNGKNKGTINIIGNNVDILGETGIYIMGEGDTDEHSTVNISGTENLKISATGTDKNAVKVTNGGSVALENSKNLILDGNIDIAGNETLKADINADFTSEISQLNGYIKTGDSAESNIEFSNNAVWNNTGNSNVTNLTFDKGIINNTSAENNISVGTLYGNGGEINMAAYIDDTTGEAVSGKLEIGIVKDENAHFDINYKGNDNLEVSQEEAKEVFDKLTDNITVGEGELKADVKLEEGFIKGGYTADLVVDKNGSQVGNIDYELNSMVEGMRDLATINLLTWRQEMNSLNKRMGELRNSTGEHGVWSRVYTGKIENGSKYDNDYQTYQVGYDKKYTVDNGVMFVGGLVSYTDGETDYALGHGENYSVGAGIYATWLNNDGQFADVVLKQSRLHNKFDVRSIDGDKSQHGDYNNWGTSLSGQYGKRFDLNDKFFVEPSVELTLGRVDDTTYTTSAGVDVHQDTMYSLVGNVGTAVGYKFSDKGNVYARAALVKEFQGDIDTEYEKDGAVERTSEDLGDTWAEFGIGVNYRFVENMNVYVDVQKTGEATVDNKWQANLGFRYEF